MSSNRIMTLIAPTLLVLLLATGCTNANDAQRALSNAGYTDIVTGGYDWFSCGEDDFYSTKFTAKNTAGNIVSGTVCSAPPF